MSLAQVLSTYLNMNLLIVIGFVGLSLFSFVMKRTKSNLGAGTELRLHYAVMTIILILTVIHPLLPRNEVFSPAAKVWSAQSIKSFGQDYTAPDKGGYLSLPTLMGTSTLQADQVAITWGILGALLLILGGLFIGRDLRVLFKTKKNSFSLRKSFTLFSFGYLFFRYSARSSPENFPMK